MPTRNNGSPDHDRLAQPVAWHSVGIALPYPDARSAAAGLRAELRHEFAVRGGTEQPDWDTLVLTGPVESRGRSGSTWYEYTLGVACRPRA